jgi:hypothetical protein
MTVSPNDRVWTLDFVLFFPPSSLGRLLFGSKVIVKAVPPSQYDKNKFRYHRGSFADGSLCAAAKYSSELEGVPEEF